MPLSLTYRPLRSLVPSAKNARVHSPAQIAQLKGSLAHWGWTNPVLIADSTILCGHGRIIAALEMAEANIPIPGHDDLSVAPVVDLSHLSKEDRAAYAIADNKLALNAGWDEEILAEELGWLAEAGFDLNLMGFEEDELADLLDGVAPGDGPDPDDAPEPPQTPVTRTGDIWVLGRHRLACADATDPEMVARLFAGVTPHLCVTDPPYGTDYDPSWRLTKRKADGSLLSTGRNRALGVVENDNRSDWADAWSHFPGDVIYCWTSDRGLVGSHQSLTRSGFAVRNQIIWAKSALVVSRGHYHHQHESCWYAVREMATAHWNGGTKQSTLWVIDKLPKNDTGHSAQKPVECMQRPILNNSNAGQCVYDPFVGSGTTIIAAEQTGRCALAIEINPAYVDVSILRWQTFTGNAAVLEETGLTYAEMAQERPTEQPSAA